VVIAYPHAQDILMQTCFGLMPSVRTSINSSRWAQQSSRDREFTTSRWEWTSPPGVSRCREKQAAGVKRMSIKIWNIGGQEDPLLELFSSFPKYSKSCILWISRAHR